MKLKQIKTFYLFIKNKILTSNLLVRIFNKLNLTKVIIIFIVGFSTRIFIAHVYSINVFTDYLNNISIIYYIFFSIFIVLVHELVHYFNLNIIPSFLYINGMTGNNNNITNIINKGKSRILTKNDKDISSEGPKEPIYGSDTRREVVDRFYSEEEINRLRESRREASRRQRGERNRGSRTGLQRGQLTRFRREERLASDQR